MTEQQKIQNLKKHKAIATGLFLFMAVVYFAMVYLDQHMNAKWIGYVEAFAEAGMVGALADWFAVTALFRYPLGLKIPHTNLIENSQKAIGDNLGHFVTDNFLTPSTIRPYIEKLEVVKYAADWLNKPSNQEGLQEELINFSKKIITDLDDKDIDGFEHARKDDMGLEPEDTQEKVTPENNGNIDKRVDPETEISDGDIPLYDEVVKSLEFSELNTENESAKVPRRVELGPEPEKTQEKVLVEDDKK